MVSQTSDISKGGLVEVPSLLGRPGKPVGGGGSRGSTGGETVG